MITAAVTATALALAAWPVQAQDGSGQGGNAAMRDAERSEAEDRGPGRVWGEGAGPGREWGRGMGQGRGYGMQGRGYGMDPAETAPMGRWGGPRMGRMHPGHGWGRHGGPGGMGPRMMPHGMMTVMFVLMDADGNGTLSLEEVLAVEERFFNRADADGDGELTEAELMGFIRALTRGPGMGPRGGGPRGPRGGGQGRAGGAPAE
jgi:hypothetical protein